MATSSAPWKMTRSQRRDLTKALGVPVDYFEGLNPDQLSEVSEKQRQETKAYVEALMKVVAERMKCHP
jgi:hypothetical protein